MFISYKLFRTCSSGQGLTFIMDTKSKDLLFVVFNNQRVNKCQITKCVYKLQQCQCEAFKSLYRDEKSRQVIKINLFV